MQYLRRTCAQPVLFARIFSTTTTPRRTLEGEWEYVLGLQTIDRSSGRVDEATHHITDRHVAHHMLSDMPHYRLEKATAAVRGVLEFGLQARDTRDFVAKTFALHDAVGHCVERDRPRATKAEIQAWITGKSSD